MKVPLYTVDAFTDQLFKGNPAAVCLNRTEWKTDQCQLLAREMNLSETAFVRPWHETETHETDSEFGLRWLTPTTEVSLCGHATLAAAHVLFSECQNTNAELTFHTLSGPLYCHRTEQPTRYELTFPSLPVFSVQPQAKATGGDKSSHLASADFVEIAKKIAGQLGVKQVAYAPTAKKLLLTVDPKTTVAQLEAHRVDPRALKAADPDGHLVRGVAITVAGAAPYDIVTRYFAPWVGINEDPATGSLHCALAPYWCNKLNKTELFARQAYPGRGAEFRLRLSEDASRVHLTGDAITVISGSVDV